MNNIKNYYIMKIKKKKKNFLKCNKSFIVQLTLFGIYNKDV